ncbi:MAG TPA: ketopantoate reductase family protein [Candidatus Binataceae bacterium]|nr:ketopantoate reductase family protein [Candidatus Binataceae bacterium]
MRYFLLPLALGRKREALREMRGTGSNHATMETRRILIAGAGAIGSVMGGMLRRAGHDVTMLGRSTHLEAIGRDGLHLGGLFGDHVVKGFTLASDPSQLGAPFEFVLLTVKSYDTAAVADQLRNLAARDGLVVSMQNGIGNIAILVEHFGAARVLGGRVIFGAEIVAPGRVEVTVFADPIAVGPAPAIQPGESARLFERARELAAILSGAGIPTEPCADVIPLLWTKLFYNAALNPLGALLRLHYGALAADPDLRAIMDAVIEEAFAVAARSGVALPYRSAGEYRAVFYSRLVPSTFNHRPTMLYDLEQRGRTDIAEMNGKIAELARGLGLRAETNRILTRLIRARERMWSANNAGAAGRRRTSESAD